MSQEQAISARLQQELKEIVIREALAVGKVDIHEAKLTHLTRELEVQNDMQVFELYPKFRDKLTSTQAATG